jgi:transcriptional antiterminator RfaH
MYSALGKGTMGQQTKVNVDLPSTNPLWYAIRAKSKQEPRAEANLRAWGVETFLPVITSHAKWSRTRPMAEALFPGYLFARFHALTMANKIRFTRGVTQIVGSDQGLSPIDDEIILLIRGRIGSDGRVKLSEDFKAGDQVRIRDGPLRDLVGVFHSAASGAQRVTLLLAAANRQWRVSVDRTLLEKLPQASTGA